MHEPPPVAGRWDLTVQGRRAIIRRGWRCGSRDIARWSGRSSAAPAAPGLFPGWISRTAALNSRCRLSSSGGRTTSILRAGSRARCCAARRRMKRAARRLGGSPRALAQARAPRWGEPVELFNRRDLAGWKPRNPAAKNGWLVREGVLVNAEPGNDLVTEGKFTDFKLHAEFRYPRGSNSGIYLRGRYEVQIEDNYGEEPDSHKIGGMYGFLTPMRKRREAAGQWQTVEVTLVGRTVTVVLNGERVIDRQAIPGITGGARQQRGRARADHAAGRSRDRRVPKVTLTPGE